MQVFVSIIDGPLPATTLWEPPTGAGAAVSFEGVVRPLEAGQSIAALDYEIYEPMAGQSLRKLGSELLQRHGLLSVWVEHSRGRVPVGCCSFRLRIASAHRQEALTAVAEFIDFLKRDVPIWKTAVPQVAAPSGGAA